MGIEKKVTKNTKVSQRTQRFHKRAGRNKEHIGLTRTNFVNIVVHGVLCVPFYKPFETAIISL